MKPLQNYVDNAKVYEDLNPIKIQKIFEKIPAQDYILLDMQAGLCSPKDMLIEYLLVPPICIRPSVKQSTRTS